MMSFSTNDADILQECLTAIAQGKATLQDCVNRYPAVGDLQTMLEAAQGVGQAPKVTMSTSSKDALQQRLIAQMHTPTSKPISRRLSPQLLRISLTLAVFVIVVLTSSVGLVYAAQSALPGDALYGLKRTTEQTRLTFASAQSRPDVLSGMAATRLSEMEALIKRGQIIGPSFYSDVLNSLNTAAAAQPDSDRRAELYKEVDEVTQLMALNPNQPDSSGLNAVLETLATSTPVPTANSTDAALLTSTPNAVQTELDACSSDANWINSLMVKLNNHQVRAFINEVQAQSGKNLSVACANQLISLANQLQAPAQPTKKPKGKPPKSPGSSGNGPGSSGESDN